MTGLLAGATGQGIALQEGVAAFKPRSARLRRIVGDLRELEAQKRLAVSIDQLAESQVHMHLNRLLRSEQRKHELLIYDLLARACVQRLARA